MSAWWSWPLPLTLKLVRIIARGMDNLPTNFGVSRTFRPQLISQHLSRITWPCDLDLGCHGTYCWCGSICSVCVPSLNFVGLPVRNILCINCLSISRPGDLDLWPWNWCALSQVGWTTILPILVFLARFILDLSANTCQTRHVTLRPLRSQRMLWCGSSSSVSVPSLKFVGLPVLKILGIYCVSINRPGDLNLLTSK